MTSLVLGTVFTGGRSHSFTSLSPGLCSTSLSQEREKQIISLLVLGCGVHPKLGNHQKKELDTLSLSRQAFT